LSVHYCIELYFPVERLESAFVELIKHIDEQNNHPYDIRLSNGTAITTFCSSSSPPRIYHGRTGIDWISFDTIFLFPVDAVIQEYMDARDVAFANDPRFPKTKELLVIKDNEKYFPVGYFSVSIGYGKKYARLSVSTVSSSQNKMIRNSVSIHRTFLHVLDAGEGVAGLINVETRDYVVLMDTARTIYQNREPFDDANDIDAIEEDLIVKLAKS